jgi:hypothetical protein
MCFFTSVIKNLHSMQVTLDTWFDIPNFTKKKVKLHKYLNILRQNREKIMWFYCERSEAWGGMRRALNVTKTSRLRYDGHMIRRPEDLPQKALFRAKPMGRRNQGRPKSRWADGVNSDSLAQGVRDWMHCAQDRQSWKDLLQQALILVVVPHK